MGTFKAETKDQINIISCPEDLDGTAAKQLSVLSQEWLALGVTVHVFDFKTVENLSSAAYRPFIAFRQALTSVEKKLFTINLASSISKQIQADGLASVFSPASSLNDVMAKSGLKKPVAAGGFNIEFVTPFVSAVQVAIKTQANTPLTAGKPYAKKEAHTVQFGIACVINLASVQFTGSIALLFPTPVFLEIYSNMFGEKCEALTKAAEDAAGELLNIIFGLAKAALNSEKGYSIQKAVPTVLTGDGLKPIQTNVAASIVLPFETKAGPFFLEVTFEKS